MRAFHCRQKVQHDGMWLSRDLFIEIDRLVVPMDSAHERSYLIVYFFDEMMGAFMVETREKLEQMGLEVIAEVDVSANLVGTALALSKVVEEGSKHMREYEEVLLGGGQLTEGRSEIPSKE